MKPQVLAVARRLRWRSRTRRLLAIISATLLRPPETIAAMVAIAGYTVLMTGILAILKFPQDLFMDSTEAYAWGEQFLGGYGRHPPLTGWIAGIWYRIFPAENWSSYALSHLVIAVTLTGIYFVARRALDPRRALFVVFILMLCPLFHTNSDRYNNSQVLAAILPLEILAFLNAFSKRTATSGVLLGLSAAAAALTIYAGLVGLFAIGVAGLLDRNRVRFFASPAPYCAALVFVAAIAVHISWLFHANFASLHWAQAQARPGNPAVPALSYVAEQCRLLAMPLIAGALALWPFRQRACKAVISQKSDTFLVSVIAIVLVAAPPVVCVAANVQMREAWGWPFFFLVPVLLLALIPSLLVTRRAVGVSSTIVAAWIVILLIAAPIYPWFNIEFRPNQSSYKPASEMALDVTRLWRERFHKALPLVVSYFDLASAAVFYSPDHPRMYADFNADFSPWIDYPADLQHKGFVGVCEVARTDCVTNLDKLAPQAERTILVETRTIFGKPGLTARYLVWIVPPAQ
jgi:4-amino-4-deoxy-L-arabinose transferase-like glycosyltransferase